MRAHQFAFMPNQAMRASRADLAMMVHRRLIHLSRTNYSALRRTRSNPILENSWPLGKHG